MSEPITLEEQFKYDIFRELVTIKNMLREIKDVLPEKEPEATTEDK
jgi:hypothetical protein